MTAPTAAPRGVRRDPGRSQRDFRTLLDVLSRPGRVGRLEVDGEAPAATIPVAALADVEVPLAVLAGAGQERWEHALRVATGAPPAEPGSARMVLALRPLTAAEIAALPRGDASHPELGARLVAAVDALLPGPAAGPGDTMLTLRGPGVDGEATLAVRGLDEQAARALATANADFPAGIDTFLVAPDGAVAGLPRSTRITLRGER
ncbi:phosphonate C-P lyase system protein PhnH [Spongiactinospora sp. TRM90649]|uniref:phosphonate C-P lyase system protein PhnH n=1 Tax=Spongiactinospora sp. TRM90649 TaxID=3031114 RepID=UPI0023F8D4D5|nr:phosphonate C-P lyase system protein PhnH [Spongiactinospora sp. TRM90649]MDF5757073.1 phosphonate C-P lyase system protein PhnH [Spongiactinospora sp. TRM90649]